MPDERLITEIESLLAQVVALGGENERSQMVPNLTVQDANPTGLTGFVIVSDDRDGDNILAKKVPSVIYSNNDLVNVLFPKGGEAIAFQQGSQSANGGIWEIVPSTTTDIFYDKGDVGIGKSVTPDAALEILDTSQAQLRLTHTEDTKYVNFTLDTNHDLTVTPTSTGQIILQPTTDSTDFFQVLDSDGGTPIINVDATNEFVGIGNSLPSSPLDVTGFVTIDTRIQHKNDTDTYMAFSSDQIEFFAGSISLLRLRETIQDTVDIGDVAGGGNVNVSLNDGQVYLEGAAGQLGIGIGEISPSAKVEILDTAGPQLQLTFEDGVKFTDFTVDTSHNLTIDPSSTGLIKLNATVTVIDKIQHEGDTDTEISFTTDDIEFTAGGLSMLKLTEAAQDLITLGPGSGDVDINFNGDMFLQGSSGNFAIGPSSPINVFHVSHVNFPGMTFEDLDEAANEKIWQWIGNGGSLDIRTRTDANGAGQTAISINRSGTTVTGIGINNVTSPSTELDIGAGAIEFEEMTAPAAGAANTARLFTQDNGAGKTQLAVRFNTGAIQILATEP